MRNYQGQLSEFHQTSSYQPKVFIYQRFHSILIAYDTFVPHFIKSFKDFAKHKSDISNLSRLDINVLYRLVLKSPGWNPDWYLFMLSFLRRLLYMCLNRFFFFKIITFNRGNWYWSIVIYIRYTPLVFFYKGVMWEIFQMFGSWPTVREYL